MAIKDWSTTPANNNGSVLNGFAPENWAPSQVNNVLRIHMSNHKTQWLDAEWFDRGDSGLSRASTTSFKITGDVTAEYVTGRRLKCFDATTLYATVASSSYSAPDTTINVTMDSGTLSTSLSAVALGILRPTNISIPAISGLPGLGVAGASSLSGAVVLKTTLNVEGATTLSGNAVAKGTFLVEGATTLVGSATLKGTTTHEAATVCKTTLNVEGATSLSGTVTIKGITTHEAATILKTTLNVEGNTSLSGTVTVKGITTHEAATILKTNLTVEGTTTLSGNVVLSANLSGVTVSGSMMATQANQETGTATNLIVAPGVQQYHASAAKAWIQFTSVTTTAINVSYNITSVTDNGTGDTTITIATDFGSATYCVVESARSTATDFVFMNRPNSATYDMAAGAYRAFSQNSATVAKDTKECMVAFFGDQ